MSFSTLSQWGPLNTPASVKYLILWTSILAVLSASIQTIFEQFGISPGPQPLLSLSWWGLHNFYAWQPLTFLLIQPYSSAGITFFSLLSLAFSMYMLWVLGSAIYELVGKTAFLRFYFICGIAAGIIALLFMPLTGKYAMLAGPAPAILALLTAWSMAYPESEVLLFFLIPVKAKWIMTGLVGSLLLTALAQWEIANLILYMSAIFFGYAYACLAWGWRSPFSITQKIDRILATLGLKLRMAISLPAWLKLKKTTHKADSASKNKIVDIGTGAPFSNDDAFVDEMLAKISKYGERALSWNERQRMQQISERKSKEHNQPH